ncbi:DUF3375 domain-containing protein [Gulosibacter macacae]|uniref:DUF3375 domain-containing protein n=1 Tax=Gulosibacter macacae TaxID=2488791 RepID=A0A3P3VXP4_9MICO|nr:DUF3375 domain-containing protein [Gulosibacter macacae]RRJ87555.1 DUF3375 domain-containing protein [Gulosibacter macacae]
MSALATALALQRLLGESAALRMLRADRVALIAGTLATHLGTPGTRIATDELHELIELDLEDLRPHFDLGNKTAKAYCDDWRNAGFLIRRAASTSRAETYELSASAITAINTLRQFDEPTTTLTESRLANLSAAIHQIAIDTDPDHTRKLESLLQERERIDAEIAKINAGESTTLDDRVAMERVVDVLLQAQNLPADFARVRARFEQLNQELRTSILDSDEQQSAVLDEIFRGVDLIEASDEGRTFTAFSALLRNPEQSARLDSDVAAVLSREFSAALPPASRRAFRSLIRELKDGSRDVHGVLTEFARGLRRYVHSQEFQRDRVLRDALQTALASAVDASKVVRPFTDIGLELELSAMQFRSVGVIDPHDPVEFDTGAPLTVAAPVSIDMSIIAALARESEIDFDELTSNVNATFAARGPVSVGEVLAEYPATQGLASLIGLLSLATQHGLQCPDEVELVEWQGVDGITRSAEITTQVFTTTIDS